MSKKYSDVLKQVAARTGTTLPSLAVSFAVLHELTALVPLVAFYYGAHASGLGSSFISSLQRGSPSEDGLMRAKCRQWISEGEEWATRVGRRYNLWQVEESTVGVGEPSASLKLGVGIASGVTDAIFAYAATKVSSSPLQ